MPICSQICVSSPFPPAAGDDDFEPFGAPVRAKIAGCSCPRVAVMVRDGAAAFTPSGSVAVFRVILYGPAFVTLNP